MKGDKIVGTGPAMDVKADGLRRNEAGDEVLFELIKPGRSISSLTDHKDKSDDVLARGMSSYSATCEALYTES